MKFVIICLLLTTVHLGSAMNVEADLKFSNFLSSFPSIRIDTEEEHNLRKSLFVSVDAEIERHNADPSQSFKMQHTKFSAMTNEEKRRFLGKTQKSTRSFVYEPATEIDERQLPTNYDLRTATPCGKKIPMKNQASCGSCWAFSAIAPIEYAKCVKSGGTYTLLSDQQLVSCDTYDGGCGGGDPGNAFSWLISKNKGAVATAASYPYTSASGTRGTCKTTGLTIGATLKSYTMLQCAAVGGTASVTTAIMNAIKTYGVVANCVLVNSNAFYNYKSGVMSDPTCTGPFKGCGQSASTNHCTSIVGWGTDTASKKDYWILRNQWGTGWGNGGYMLIQKGVNMCGMESEIFYTVVA
jgi:C1A family cysteine protease